MNKVSQLMSGQGPSTKHVGHSTGMAAWAKEFDAPVYIHAKDRQWVTEPCSKIQYWEGES